MNTTDSSNSSQILQYLNLAVEITNYSNSVLSAVGTLFNLITIIILSRPTFEHTFYDFLQCRSICNLVVCLFGIFFQELPCRMCPSNYRRLFCDYYVILTQMRAAFLASSISDILLVLNRFVTLHAWSGSIFNRLSKKVLFYTLIVLF